MSRSLSSIHTETSYPHPPAAVWRALTDPVALAAWLMPNDFRPELGHTFTFRTDPVPPLFDGVVHCEVIELDPPHALAYTWRTPPTLDTIVRWELTETVVDGRPGTRVLGIHSGFDLGDPGQLAAFRAMSGGWGGGMVSLLDRVLADLANKTDKIN
ncbi:MAG TPA: SRPBCC domain-containing protein [Pseudonocardiaceae bacterium]|jgi:uncharacterized protein YndB with AHSA1/START domain|nr:SRPBCC domain-containing protein [Pseudonocardiaceae bacterium]